MFDLSTKTQVNKRFKLTELYKLMVADKPVKDNARTISSVTLSHVLSKATLNLSDSGMVKEIYIFEIILTEKTIPSLFISSLDKTINLHTLYLLRYNEEFCLYGCYKEHSEKGVRLGKFYATDWSPDREIALPLGVESLDNIYTALIDELIPIQARQNEPTKEFVARYEEILSLEKEIAKLQKQVDSEKQPKKRFELNGKLKELKKKLVECSE